ncbi:MAG: hypothetical protein B7Y88_03665 [Sphingomonadales bacterium 32-64-17]|nr:MAG: hypothetical protein B7Y88_03665 [Sphingomonadales bacterium 32-64-17]
MKGIAVMAGAICLLAAPAAMAQQERDWGGIERCAAIDEAGERYSCLDRELAALGLLGRAPVRSGAPASVAPPVQSADQSPPMAATDDTIVYEESEPRDPVMSDMTSSVATARLDRRRGLEIEAANGTRWRSTSSVSLRRAPRAGAPFAAEQGALGSYTCRIESSTYFKCERLS